MTRRMNECCESGGISTLRVSTQLGILILYARLLGHGVTVTSVRERGSYWEPGDIIVEMTRPYLLQR